MRMPGSAPAMLRTLLVCLACVPSASLLLSSTVAPSYQKLQGVQVSRVDGSPVDVTSLWRPGVLGVGSERACIFFLRHFG